MTEHPLARPMTRLVNILRRSPSPDWEALKPALLEAAAYTRTLQARTRNGLPLLAAARGFEDLCTRAETALSEQAGILTGLAEAVQSQDPETLGALVEPLERVAGRVSQTLEGLRETARRMPHFSDVPILDEMITLALNQLKMEKDFSEDLRARLPALRGFLQYLRQVAGRFRDRHPERADLAEGLEEVTGSLEQAAGGVFLYLQEGRDPVDLSQALSLMDRGLLALGRIFQGMREVQHSGLVFSENPVLDRLARSIQALQAGEPGLARMEEDLGELTRFHQGLAREAAILESATFMPLSLRDEFLPGIFELLARMDAELDLLHRRPADPGDLAEAINRYQFLASDLDRIQAGLEERLARLPSLSGAGHFEELAALLHGVYTGSVPDCRLEGKIQALRALQEQFQSQLLQTGARSAEEAEHARQVLAALADQRQALDLAEEYLGSGHRDLLLGSFEALLSPTRALIELKNRPEARSAASSQVSTCPECAGHNPPESSRCGHCARPLPFSSASGSSASLDLFDSGARTIPAGDPSSLSGNFRRLVEILEDAGNGRLPAPQAREQIAGFLQTLERAENQMREQVAPLVRNVEDQTLSSYQEELETLVAYLREIVEAVLEALDFENPTVLPEMQARLQEVGEALARFHEEVTRAGT